MVHLEGPLVGGGDFDFLVVHREDVAGVAGGGFGGDVAAVAVDPEVVGVPGIGGGAEALDAVREDEVEVVDVFHFFKPVYFELVAGSVDFDRVGAGEVAEGLDGVDSDFADGAVAAELSLGVPAVVPAHGEAVVAADGSEGSEGAGAAEAHGLEVVRLEVAAVADAESPVDLLRHGDHFFGFFQIASHRLFAADMLSGGEGAHGELVVRSGRGDDVDDFDVRVVFDLLQVLVVVDLAFGDAIFAGDSLGFVRATADDGDGLAEFAVVKVRQDVPGGVSAEAEDGPADGLCRLLEEVEVRKSGQRQAANTRHHFAPRKVCHERSLAQFLGDWAELINVPPQGN